MTPLKQALDRIDNWINIHTTPFAKRLKSSLKPGISKQEFDKMANSLPYFLPQEIYELYAWHDGRFQVGYTSEAVYFCSLNSAIEQATSSYLVAPPYFPFMLADEWGAYVIEGDPAECKRASPVYFYSKDGQQVNNLAAPSISNIMTALAECLETHGFCSAAQAALSDNRLKNVQPSEEMNLLPAIELEYKPIFSEIYRQYDIEDIWD